MATTGQVVKDFYAAVVNRDLASAREYLVDDLVCSSACLRLTKIHMRNEPARS